MKSQPVLIDTNLLVLLIVGTASREYIGKHKRLSQFIAEDYDTLLGIISNASAVLVTPNTLSETSNLAAYIGEPARTQIFATLRQLVAISTEVYIPSKSAVARKEFLRLDLTDSAVIEALSDEATLLTTDLDLFLAAQATGASAINFNQVRDQYL